MSSLGVYSVALAGWSSASKYSVVGGLRAAAQMMSYEVFMGLALTGVVLLSGSFDLNRIVEGQRGLWYVIPQFRASSSSCWPASPRCAASRSIWSRPRASSWPATGPSTPA